MEISQSVSFNLDNVKKQGADSSQYEKKPLSSHKIVISTVSNLSVHSWRIGGIHGYTKLKANLIIDQIIIN